MRKKRSIAKSRAASMKVHRTIARMKEARLQYDYERGQEFMDYLRPHGRPAYILRALPNPWLDMK